MISDRLMFDEIRTDDQRRLRLADEDVGRGGEALRTREAHRFVHHPREREYHALQDSEIVENRTEGREEDDRRQHLHREDVSPGLVLIEQLRTKHKGGSFLAEIQQVDEETRHAFEPSRHEGHLQQQHREHDLQAHAPGHETPVYAAAVFAERPAQAEEHADPERGPQHRGEVSSHEGKMQRAACRRRPTRQCTRASFRTGPPLGGPRTTKVAPPLLLENGTARRVNT